MTSLFAGLPLFIPALALSFNKLATATESWFPQVSLYLMGIWVVTGIFIGWFGTRDDSTSFKFFAIISFLISAGIMTELLTVGAVFDEPVIGLLVSIAVATATVIPLSVKSVNREMSVASIFPLSSAIGSICVVAFFFRGQDLT